MGHYMEMEPENAAPPEIVNTEIPAAPWKTREILAGIGLVILLNVVFALLIIWLSNKAISIDQGLVALLTEAVFLFAAWFFSVRFYKLGWSSLGFTKFRPAFIGLGCGFIALTYVFNIIYSLLVLFPLGLTVQGKMFSLLINMPMSIGLSLAITVVSPFCEEVFFRGFLFAGLRQKLGWKLAAVISSAFFAAMHLEWTALLPIFLLGLFLAFLYERSRSLWPSIMMHAMNNIISFGVLLLATSLQ